MSNESSVYTAAVAAAGCWKATVDEQQQHNQLVQLQRTESSMTGWVMHGVMNTTSIIWQKVEVRGLWHFAMAFHCYGFPPHVMLLYSGSSNRSVGYS